MHHKEIKNPSHNEYYHHGFAGRVNREASHKISGKIQKCVKRMEIDTGIKVVRGEAPEFSKINPENPDRLQLRLRRLAQSPPRISTRRGRRVILFALRRDKTVDELRRFGLHPRRRVCKRFKPLDRTTPAV